MFNQIDFIFSQILDLNREIEERQNEINKLVDEALQFAKEEGLETDKNTLINSVKSFKK